MSTNLKSECTESRHMLYVGIYVTVIEGCSPTCVGDVTDLRRTSCSVTVVLCILPLLPPDAQDTTQGNLEAGVLQDKERKLNLKRNVKLFIYVYCIQVSIISS